MSNFYLGPEASIDDYISLLEEKDKGLKFWNRSSTTHLIEAVTSLTMLVQVLTTTVTTFPTAIGHAGAHWLLTYQSEASHTQDRANADSQLASVIYDKLLISDETIKLVITKLVQAYDLPPF